MRTASGIRRPRSLRTVLGLAALCLLAALAPARADEPKIVARLDPEVLGLDEAAILSIEVGAEGFASLAPKPTFELTNFEIVAGPSRSENFRFVNGETARSVSFQWQLRPLAVGAAKVRNLVVRLGDAEHRLADLDARVEASAPPGRLAQRQAAADPFAQLFPELFAQRQAPRAPARTPKVRLLAALDPPEPYVGQQAVFTLYLLTQTDVHRVNPRDLPDFRGFWVREIKLPDQPRPEWVEVDGERYGRVPLLRRALFPLAPGRYEIPAITVDTIVDVTELTPWGTPLARPAELRRTSERLVVPVQAVPGSSASFSGAVGALMVQAQIDPPTVTEGEAATLKLIVSGSANLRGLADPAPQFPAGIRPFPPQSASSEEITGDRLKSVRSWSYVLVPEQSGSYRIPPFELTYFDPKSREFRQATAPALTLAARPRPQSAAVAPAVGTPAGNGAEPTPTGARAGSRAGAEADSAADRSAGPSWMNGALWAAGGALASLAAVGLFAAFRRSRSPRARSRQRLLGRLEAARLEPRPRQVAGLIEDAWRDYLAERWHLPASTPSEKWGELLASQGAGAEVTERLVGFLGDLHLLRFAPELAATDTLASDLVERSRQLARDLH